MNIPGSHLKFRPRFIRAVLQFIAGISSAVQGGFYFHLTDGDLSAGIQDRKKPLRVAAPLTTTGEPL
jgi:hypothetical protein